MTAYVLQMSVLKEIHNMVLILECIVVCFILFVPCVIVIANGIHNGAFLFERDVQERVVKMGLISARSSAGTRISLRSLHLPL